MTDDSVVKTGHRVREQREWLLAHRCPAVVSVSTKTIGNSMIMERLQPFTLQHYLTPRIMVDTVLHPLKAIWDEEPEVDLDLDMHMDKVNKLASEVGVAHEMLRAVRRVVWEALPATLTHGDPTFENTMHRGDEVAVLIDPVPATPAVPDLRCVDIGKVMQSLHGWEAIRYSCAKPRRTFMWKIFDEIPQITDEEIYASRYWHTVHWLRIVPYVTHDLDLKSLVEGVARDLARML